MNIAVEQSKLADAITHYRFAYLMTSGTEGSPPHAVPVRAHLQGAELVVDGVGPRTRANALVRPVVGLVWPPESDADYSLIVDGQATLEGDALLITPKRAVLHRQVPAPEPQAPGACKSDCIELKLA